MESLITQINTELNLTNKEIFGGDPRVASWFLMDSPGLVLILAALYLLFVRVGPTFMEKRAPMSLTPLLMVYNFALVILTAYVFWEMLMCGVLQKYSLICQPINYENTEMGMREANAAWWYFFSKVIELLDTVFFILRKKNNQVTFLHVYHHSSMLCICWYVAKYVPGGEKFYNGGFNCAVHVLMYTYYGLAAMGPQVQKYLWWKRYLTEFQLVQFMFVNVRAVAAVLSGPCEYPRWINIFALFYSSSMLYLFLRFYRRSYKAKAISASAPNGSTSSSISNGATNGAIQGSSRSDKKEH